MRLARLLGPRRVPGSPASVSVPRPYRGQPLTCVDSDAGPLWFQASDGVMLPYVTQNHTWDPDVGGLLTALVHPGATFVDIGANVGYFSRLIATRCAPSAIHAFEPHPDLVDVLSLNVWGLTPAVTVWPVALGDGNGTVTLESAEHNIGDTRVFAASTGPASMIAAVARLDDLLSGPVDVVKIDVQGFETEVLRGMQRVIVDNPTIKIAVEFWPGALRERGQDPRSVLAQYRAVGFETNLLRGSAPHAADADEILRFCESAGPNGQANLLLAKP